MAGFTALAVEQADVIVVTAHPTGVAAAVVVAKTGSKVILLEESVHVGGIIADGLTNTDIHKHGAVGGLYNEWKCRIVEHYGGGFEQAGHEDRVSRHDLHRLHL